MTEHCDPDVEAAVDAAAKAFYDKAREKQYLRWETCSDRFRGEIRDLVRPAAIAAFALGRQGAATERR